MDGTKVTQSPTQPQRITDRNGNYVEIVGITYNGNPALAVRDQQSRQIVLQASGNYIDTIHNLGFGGVDLAQEVHWKTLQVGGKEYKTVEPVVGPNPNGYPEQLGTLMAVSEIRLPSQSGPIKYTFGYNAQDHGSVPWGTPSVGLGELSSITLLADGVEQYNVQYKYLLDNQYGPSEEFKWDYLLNNAVTRKTLTYNEVYDGTTSPVTEVTNYWGAVTTPEGGVIVQGDDSQRTYWTQTPDGTIVEKVWAANTPQGFPTAFQIDPRTGINAYDPARANGFVKWEITSIRDQNNVLVKSAIKEFTQDKNGNFTSVAEYDWVPYGDVPRNASGFVTGIPASAIKKRVTSTTLARSTPDSTDSSSNTADSYWNYTAPNLRSAVSSINVGNGTTTLSRTELFYDNSGTTGNLVQQKVWDSTKGAISIPLSANNSISTSTQYDGYGNVILTTDAAGTQTSITYGAINGFTNLYPTQVVVASNVPSLARTATSEYDFSTGLITRSTDVNNNVSTATSFDAFGRPVLVKVAENTAQEVRTVTEYSDLLRRVIVKSDLATLGDGKLVTVQHYDPLGRVRLTRQLEDATTQSATNETHGIKTQTRYRISNPCAPESLSSCLTANATALGSYTLVSSPYRAATAAGASAETTMGWTRSRTDNAGRVIEVQTFGGTSLPAPWGSSSTSTGTVTSSYDANSTTVVDQAQKKRRSLVDGLGRLIRVDEPDGNGNLGSLTSPIQPTHYTYDALGNLTHITQSDGVTTQYRDFIYSSLSRLTRATNPESGEINYQYGDSGNLIVKTDARLSVHYSYDALNRVTRRWYNSSNSVTATTHNSPALPAGVGTTDEIKFYYDAQSLPSGAPSYSRGASIGRLVATTYGTGSNGDYFAYDVHGRSPLKIQQIGAVNYQMSASYNLANAVTSLTYPSGRTITNSYDLAGRLTAFSGNLGDGTTRNYSTGILYSSTGALQKEQFGTATPVYNKLFYNSRQQLAEIRASTSYTGPTDIDSNRGAIINNYSDQCTGTCAGSSMSDNNGNLRKQEIHIPNNTMRWQQYEYDSLNRLKWAREVLNGGAEQWKQQFSYDRWGNRTIDAANTYGTGINEKGFTVNTSNNRLGVPGGQSGVMTYDAVGNLTDDTYTGFGNRTYDGENKITSAMGQSGQTQLYKYDGSGQRIKRTVDGVETWHVYGFGGELVAEYEANGAAASPQKEYGYRNGQLLVVANPTPLANLALNKTATQSSTHASGAVAARAVDGNTDGVFANGSVTHTLNDANAWWQLDLGQVQSIDTIKVWNRVEFPERLTNFYVFVSDVPFTSTNLTTTQNQAGVSSYHTAGQGGFPTQLSINRTGRHIRVQLAGTNYLSIAELQVLGTVTPTNVALSKTATQSSTSNSAPASRAVDGNADGVFANGSVTHTQSDLNAWWHVDLGQVESIGTIKIWNRAEFPERLTNFYVFVSDHPFTSTDLTTTQNQAGVSSYHTAGQCGFPTELAINRPGRYVRVQLAGTNYLSIAEVQVWTGSSGPEVQWLVSDHLGTPRIIIDQTGSQANVKRHDYLPFGEELFAPMGGRTTAMGYASGNGVRQQFTGQERDVETGLDYFGARYYGSAQGRFTGCDPKPLGVKQVVNPQRWNRYSYVINNPLALFDPDGQDDQGGDGGRVIDIFLFYTEKDNTDRMTASQQREFNAELKRARAAGIEVNVSSPSGNVSMAEDAMDSMARPGRIVIMGVHAQEVQLQPSGRKLYVGMATETGAVAEGGRLNATAEGGIEVTQVAPPPAAALMVAAGCGTHELAEIAKGVENYIGVNGGSNNTTSTFALNQMIIHTLRTLVNSGGEVTPDVLEEIRAGSQRIIRQNPQPNANDQDDTVVLNPRVRLPPANFHPTRRFQFP